MVNAQSCLRGKLMASREGLETTTQRKLSCILAADAAGYSRLMGDDEKATEHTLTEYRQVFAQHIALHQGRVVDTAGDSVLAVFDSPVEAVECAAEIQKELAPQPPACRAPTYAISHRTQPRGCHYPRRRHDLRRWSEHRRASAIDRRAGWYLHLSQCL